MKRADSEPQYGPSRQVACSDAIMNTVLTISHDGPPPMINMRPVPKNPNAADTFELENQQYMDRESDRVARVDQHNAAFPKLIDELDKRNSLINIRAVRKRRNYPRSTRGGRYTRAPTQHCKVCKRRKEDGKRKAAEKNRKNREWARVAKNRIIVRNAATSSMYKFMASRGCQHWTEIIHKGTSPHTSLVEIKMEGVPPKEADLKTDLGLRQNTFSKTKTDSMKSIKKYAGTSVASLSSYDSYLSMDHEPMVKEDSEKQL